MKILNIKKLEKNIAVLWDGQDDTLFYLNNIFITSIFEEKNEEEPDYYSILKFEKQKNNDLLLTYQYYFDKSEIHLKTFKIDDYVLLRSLNSIHESPSFVNIQKDELINTLKDIEAALMFKRVEKIF